MNSTDPTRGDESLPRRRGARRWSGRVAIAAMLLLAIVVCLPWIVGNKSVLNALLRSGLSKNEIEAQIGAARLGWFTPASLYDIQLKDQQQRWTMKADRASTELTLWQLIWSGGDLGEFRIKGPTLVVDASRPWPGKQDDPEEIESHDMPVSDGRLRLTIEDGTLLVLTTVGAEPDEFLKGANVTVEYTQQQGERILVVEPGRPIEEAQLTREMCSLGIKYVVPILADVTWVRGSMSLQLDECRIPLNRPAAAKVSGRLEIRAVESGLQESLAGQITQLVARLGMESVPESVKLAEDSVVEFRVADGLVHHQDLAFGLPGVAPDLVITTRGTVGMDGSLDLVATLPPFGDSLGDGLLGQAVRGQQLTLPVRGTLDNPKISLEGHQQILGSLLNQVVPSRNGDKSGLDEDTDVTLDEVGETVGEVLDLLRARRQKRLERRDAEDQPPRLFDRIRDRRGRNGAGDES